MEATKGPSKRCYPTATLNVITTQKTPIRIFTAVKTSYVERGTSSALTTTKFTNKQWKESQSGWGKTHQQMGAKWNAKRPWKGRTIATREGRSATWRLPVGSDVDKRRCQRHAARFNNSGILHPSDSREHQPLFLALKFYCITLVTFGRGTRRMGQILESL
jgi:hypothetical protein